jgi:hypothetical protein
LARVPEDFRRGPPPLFALNFDGSDSGHAFGHFVDHEVENAVFEFGGDFPGVGVIGKIKHAIKIRAEGVFAFGFRTDLELAVFESELDLLFGEAGKIEAEAIVLVCLVAV